ncbi:hypothetical protein [Paenarthrobacter sp. NPDC091669]|uniref:hypothetical protein n=1 Tax=Paenarthrobacter sp. NPDC091669 TaxID=3364384 RepID=UPI0037FC0EE8
MTARFVAHLHECDDVGFSYLEESAKGAILAAVVTLDTSSFRNSLSTLSVYLDTPVLIQRLGYSGEAAEKASTQLFELVRSQGASLKVFEHTLRELDGVLQSAENFSRNSQRREARPIDLLFQDAGLTAADIVLARERLPERISELDIKTATKPGDYQKYGLDEDELEKSLQDVVHYKSVYTRSFDVESISAIHRLRRGFSRGTLDRCGAVLLTANLELVRAVQQLGDERHEWPLAMTDSAVAGILWARSPAVAADLPRSMVLAAAYAGMQPDPHFWSKYLDEVSALEARGAVSADDAVVLRSTTVGRTAVMEETLGVEDEITADSPLAVLSRLRHEIEQPLVAQLRTQQTVESNATSSANAAAEAWIESSEELDRLSTKLESQTSTTNRLERRLNEIRDQQAQSQLKARAAADHKAKTFVRSALWILSVPFIALVVVKLTDPPWLTALPDWVPWLGGAAGVVAAVLAVLDSMGQGTIVQWLAPVEKHIADSIMAKELGRAILKEVQPGGSPEGR